MMYGHADDEVESWNRDSYQSRKEYFNIREMDDESLMTGLILVMADVDDDYCCVTVKHVDF